MKIFVYFFLISYQNILCRYISNCPEYEGGIDKIVLRSLFGIMTLADDDKW